MIGLGSWRRSAAGVQGISPWAIESTMTPRPSPWGDGVREGERRRRGHARLRRTAVCGAWCVDQAVAARLAVSCAIKPAESK